MLNVEDRVDIWISSRLLWISRNFVLTPSPVNKHFFPRILAYPLWNCNDFYFTTLEFFIDILNEGVTHFFQENPITSW